MGFPGGLQGKESTCNAGDLGSIPGLGGSPRRGATEPLHHKYCSRAQEAELLSPCATTTKALML